MRLLTLGLLSLTLGACLTATAGAARAQEAANEFNLQTRFGRMEVATEKLVPASREELLRHRLGWGTRIRIGDSETAGIRMIGKENTEAEVSVKVSWYRQDEGELNVTVLKQRWRDVNGDWRLFSEERADGNIGLIGEAVKRETERADARPVQFPTVRLTGASIEQ
jgi:hypothetical protein